MNITNITEGYKDLKFTLTERYTTAIDMYNLMLKLNTEQETSGEFDILMYKLDEEFKHYNLMVNLHHQVFTGKEDVIFEMEVIICMDNNCKLDNKDLSKEYILGSVLKIIKEHFDFYYRNHSSNIEVVKHYFRNY